MIKKYIDINNYIEFFKLIRWYKLYILSLIILPIGFLVNNKMARVVVVISSVLFIVCVVMNFIESGRHGDNFKKKKPLLIKEALYLIFICTMYKFIFDIPKFIYYDFLFGKLPFSLTIFSYIMLWHFILFIGWFLTCTFHFDMKIK